MIGINKSNGCKTVQSNSSFFIGHSYFFIAEQQRSDYTYTGREYNRESGQYYYRARTYLSRIGRFNSKDSVGYPGYNYVRNNPMRYRDPLGRHAWDDISKYFKEHWIDILTFVILGPFALMGCAGPAEQENNYGEPGNRTDEQIENECQRREDNCIRCCHNPGANEWGFDPGTAAIIAGDDDCIQACMDFVDKCENSLKNDEQGVVFGGTGYSSTAEKHNECVRTTFAGN